MYSSGHRPDYSSTYYIRLIFNLVKFLSILVQIKPIIAIAVKNPEKDFFFLEIEATTFSVIFCND